MNNWISHPLNTIIPLNRTIPPVSRSWSPTPISSPPSVSVIRISNAFWFSINNIQNKILRSSTMFWIPNVIPTNFLLWFTFNLILFLFSLWFSNFHPFSILPTPNTSSKGRSIIVCNILLLNWSLFLIEILIIPIVFGPWLIWFLFFNNNMMIMMNIFRFVIFITVVMIMFIRILTSPTILSLILSMIPTSESESAKREEYDEFHIIKFFSGI